MHAIFHLDTDGYSYSFEVFLAIFATEGEADTALLKRIELAEALKKEKNDFRAASNDLYLEINECKRRTADPTPLIRQLKKLELDWRVRLTNLGIHYDSDMPDADINNYEIRPIELGKFYDGTD